MNYDIAIIGAGVIGSAIAREASKYNLNIALIEKEADVAEGISKANSGVVHAGFNVKTGSKKARFNIEGLLHFPKICYELDVPYRLCKKLVVASNDDELKELERLYTQGIKNGCKGLSIINEKKIKKLEPLISGKYALYSEKTAIISPYTFTIALAENAAANGVKLFLESEVVTIKNENEVFNIQTKDGKLITAKYVINAAGVFSDSIYSMVTEHEYKIYPCRGEYYILDVESEKYLKMAVYPVPPKDGSGLGVHLTPSINGNILIGPSADYIGEKDDVANTKEIMNILKKEAYELLPELKGIPFIKNYSGIRPKLFNTSSGANFEDFIIEESDKIKNFINLIGIESPGLTSAPAIAKYVIEELIGNNFNLKIKKDFIKERVGIKRSKFLKESVRRKLIKKDKNYGEIICRCELVTKAEILAGINNPLGVKTLNGIKKRTYAMTGRCQGGFCIPRISQILTEELGVSPDEVKKNRSGSNLYEGYEN